jgi:cephalosporin hydroxylase
MARESSGSTAYLRSQGGAEAVPTGFRGFVARHRPRPLPYRRTWRRRLGAWLIDLNTEVMRSATWMGVPAAKNPLDAWIYQEIINETRPQAIVELGSAYGGGTLFLAQILDLVGGDGIVVSVDIARDVYQAEHDRIVEVTGSTGSQDVVDQVHALCAGKRTMVVHDASHRAAQVYDDLHAFAPLVSPGCYLIVEDGVTDVLPARTIGTYPGPGPYRAVEAFLRDGAPFDVDLTRERFFATNNPRGFLRRRDETPPR